VPNLAAHNDPRFPVLPTSNVESRRLLIPIRARLLEPLHAEKARVRTDRVSQARVVLIDRVLPCIPQFPQEAFKGILPMKFGGGIVEGFPEIGAQQKGRTLT
jgi:hypothetical protein